MQHLFSTDCDDLRREKENLERALEGIRKDYQAEMGRLEDENKQLRERALKEKEESDQYRELVNALEEENSFLKQELELAKGEILTNLHYSERED